jgi:hypothetical protein
MRAVGNVEIGAQTSTHNFIADKEHLASLAPPLDFRQPIPCLPSFDFMNTEQSFPQVFLDTYGKCWSASAAELDDEYSVGYLADGLRQQIAKLFRSEWILAKAPKMQVHVAILPRADVRIFVWRDERRPHEFVLAIHIGTFEKFTELLSNAELWRPLMPKLKYLSRLVEADFRRLANYMTVYAVACHEFAHIFRGHIDFLDSLPRTDPSRLLEGRKLCEVDADQWGCCTCGKGRDAGVWPLPRNTTIADWRARHRTGDSDHAWGGLISLLFALQPSWNRTPFLLSSPALTSGKRDDQRSRQP